MVKRSVLGLALALTIVACNSVPSASVGPAGSIGATDSPTATGATAQDPGTIDFTPDSPSCSDDGTFSAAIVLSAPGGAPTLAVTFTKVDESGTETPVGHADLRVPSSVSTTVTDGPLNVADWCTDAMGAGTYHWVVTRPSDGTELADGLLTIAA